MAMAMAIAITMALTMAMALAMAMAMDPGRGPPCCHCSATLAKTGPVKHGHVPSQKRQGYRMVGYYVYHMLGAMKQLFLVEANFATAEIIYITFLLRYVSS